MQSDFRRLRIVLLVAFGGLLSSTSVQADPSGQETLDAMRKASDFMMNTVSYRGGFVDKYTEDLSERWGEVPARPTMIWVQETGTVSVGKAMLDAYKRTGDAAFLVYAERVANALIWGQLPCGGWHYFIDFDPEGTQQWYHEELEKAWGWEEFYHWSGNATFDDNTSIGAASFLVDVYETTQKPEYRIPVEKAIQLVLDAQYHLGGWPQRYPLSYDAPFEGRPDYSSFYTFNDGVISGCVQFLLRAHTLFGDVRYHDAAIRGMFFTYLSQMPRPQAGWAQQYDMDLKPAQARSYEPASVNPSQTVENIHALMKYYKTTGDRRFLRGIPDAIDWLKSSPLPAGQSSDGHTHAQFLEVGTNKPLYAHRSGTRVEDGRYWVDYQPGNFPDHYGMQITIDVDALRAEYERVNALTPEEAIAEGRKEAEAAEPVSAPAGDTVAKMIQSLDSRGAWVEELQVVDYTDWKYKPRRTFRGYSTATFVNNLRTLSAYVQSVAGR